MYLIHQLKCISFCLNTSRSFPTLHFPSYGNADLQILQLLCTTYHLLLLKFQPFFNKWDFLTFPVESGLSFCALTCISVCGTYFMALLTFYLGLWVEYPSYPVYQTTNLLKIVTMSSNSPTVIKCLAPCQRHCICSESIIPSLCSLFPFRFPFVHSDMLCLQYVY